MALSELIKKCRSYRRFDETYKISEEVLVDVIDNVRLIGSAKNAQPLRYITINSEELVNELTALSAWAGYLKDWKGPEVGERPTAYIFVLGVNNDSSLFQQGDAGMATQTIMLDLTERGLGGCIIGSFNKKEAMKLLDVDPSLTPLYLIALGRPVEEVVLEEMKDDNHQYWRDDKAVHHVPKRGLSEILVDRK